MPSFKPNSGGSSTSGSGGSKNYISTYNGNPGNGDFELGTTTGWSKFSTTLTSLIPTGSISASAASITTFTVQNSAPLAGTYSLWVGSSGALTAGQGIISDAFTIDTEDQAKVQTFKFYYQIALSGGSNFSGTSSNTWAVYIYDVTNSAWIQPAGVYGMTQSSGTGYCTGTFQTTSNSTQYRLAVLCVNANSGATTLYFDDFTLGPQTAPIGAIITDPVSYTPTFVGLGTVTNIDIQSWRTGAFLVIEGNFTTGTVTSTTASMTLGFNGISGGRTIATNPTAIARLGQGSVDSTTNPSTKNVTVLGTGGGTVLNFSFDASGSTTSPLSAQTGTAGFLNSTKYSIQAIVPIAGWSSNVQMSSDTDTRVVASSVKLAGSLAVGANAVIKYDTVVSDKCALYSPSTGLFTALTPGTHILTVTALTGSATNLVAKVTGTAMGYICTSGGSLISSGAVELQLNAGDTVGVFSDSAATFNAPGTYGPYNTASLTRMSGPSVIAATESVNARYTGAPPTGTLGAAFNTVTFGTKVFDSHNAYSGGTYTIPVVGKFSINAKVNVSGTFSAGNNIAIAIFKTGTIVSQGTIVAYGGTSHNPQVSEIVDCVAGDLITIRTYSDGTGLSYGSNSQQNQFSLARVGN